MDCPGPDFSKIANLPMLDLLNGRIAEFNNCRCVGSDLLDAIVTMRLTSLQCCFLLHPYIAMFLCALVPVIFVWLLSYIFKRYNGDIFVLQDMSQNTSGGEYKIKIDRNKNSIVIVSKPSYEVCSLVLT